MKFMLVLVLLTTAVWCKEVDTSQCSLLCPRIYRPVCATDHVTYSNECMMKARLCLAGLSDVVKVLHEGTCDSSVKL